MPFRFSSNRRGHNKPKNDNFLYWYFKGKGHTPAYILVQPVEKITYAANSTSRFKIIKRHDNIYHEGNISTMPDFENAGF